MIGLSQRGAGGWGLGVVGEMRMRKHLVRVRGGGGGERRMRDEGWDG